ncbi:MSMEG_4193 family putative phosphomutase [Lapillicoccus sp.]|uniref:MSMEG_4193 family putative phosphomutase n=1 Tax=Lapillicoccus sp. TaxID=1909287 RepID=UPI0032640F93
MPTVLLIRHGRTTANTSGVLAGWTPGVGLDDVGWTQIAALGERLASAGVPVVRVVSSPLQRCQETAGAVALKAASGIPVELDDRLGEAKYGAWTGRKLTDLAKEGLWRVVQDQPSAVRFPDGEEFPGESMAGMQARALEAVRAIDAAVEAEHGARAIWVAVSHGDVIKAIVADAAGAHLDQFQRIQVDPASVSAVRYTARRPFLLRTNDTGGDLASLVPPLPKDDEAGSQAEGDADVGGGAGAAPGPEGEREPVRGSDEVG